MVTLTACLNRTKENESFSVQGYQTAKITLIHQQDLKTHGVNSQKDLEEAENSFEVSEKKYKILLQA